MSQSTFKDPWGRFSAKNAEAENDAVAAFLANGGNVTVVAAGRKIKKPKKVKNKIPEGARLILSLSS